MISVKKLFGLLIIIASLAFYSIKRPAVVQAHKDLSALYTTIYANHPGPVNDQDYFFTFKMRLAYVISWIDALCIWNERDHYAVLKQFIMSFKDSHVAISAMQKKEIMNKEKQASFVLISPSIAWVCIPTFILDKQQELEIQQIIDAIIQWRLSLHDSEKAAIIFDIRDNTGGNSYYGSCIVDALFGKENASYVRQCLEKDVTIDWRVSQDTIAYLEQIIAQLKMYDSNQNQIDELSKVIQGMQQALIEKKALYTEKPCIHEVSFQKPLYNGVVILITSEKNGSAALNFIDELIVPHDMEKCADIKECFATKETYIVSKNAKCIIVGQPTNYDTDYMECRSAGLPSGIASISFPVKVYRNYPRKSGQRYRQNNGYIPNEVLVEDHDDMFKAYILNYLIPEKLKIA